MNTAKLIARQFHNTALSLGKKSPRQHRMGAMSAKRSPKNFYKGTGGRKEGRHTSKGGYVLDKSKLLNIQPPKNLSEFQLKPYVAQNTPLISETNAVASSQ